MLYKCKDSGSSRKCIKLKFQRKLQSRVCLSPTQTIHVKCAKIQSTALCGSLVVIG